MKHYDYYYELCKATHRYIREHIDLSHSDNLEVLASDLEEALGESFFCGDLALSPYDAALCVLDNIECLNTMVSDGFISRDRIDSHFCRKDWKWLDIITRLYFLPDVIRDVLCDLTGEEILYS